MASKKDSGFTLVEVIVVLAVVLLLSGIAVPLISGYVEDSKRGRAEAEVKVMAGAFAAVYKDVGIFPSRNSSGNNNVVRSFYTGPTRPTANTYINSNGHNFYQWAASTTTGDAVDNQLLNNIPQGSTSGAWPTTSNLRWRGPYLAGPSPLDPWGRPYLINVYSTFATHNTNHKRTFVICAGPNGRLETQENARSNADLAGDDIGMIIFQRP